jgi:hypothetical protein
VGPDIVKDSSLVVKSAINAGEGAMFGEIDANTRSCSDGRSGYYHKGKRHDENRDLVEHGEVHCKESIMCL